MAEMDAEQKSTAQAVAIRLWNSRWLLAASIVAVLAVDGFTGMSAYVVPLAVAVLLAAAMLPAGDARQSTESAAAIEANGLQRLSGEYLAAAVADPLIIFDRAATDRPCQRGRLCRLWRDRTGNVVVAEIPRA